MPAESAILAHAPDLAASLIDRVLNDSASSGSSQVTEEDQALLRKSFQIAEAAALVSLCEESLWNDYELLPALRDDFLGDELGALGSKVMRPEGRTIRDIRERASQETARLRKAESAPEAFETHATSSPGDFERSAAPRYLNALAQWLAPASLPEPLKKRVAEAWCPRFNSAFRHELKRHERLRGLVPETALSPQDRRFDELNRQSWRLDEVLGKLDKWAQANPGGARGSVASFVAKRTSPGQSGTGPLRRILTVGAAALLAVALLGTAFWIAFGTSPAIESFVAGVQAGRLDGVSGRVVQAAASMGSEPVPPGVFHTPIFTMQDGKNITPEQMDAAFLDLQRKQLCRASANGWVFHDRVRKQPASDDREWWLRSLAMLLEATPADEESPESVQQWRLLLPHFVALFETTPKDLLNEPPSQRLRSALSKGLLAIRVEPGRRPIPAADTLESDALAKRLSVFAEAANANLETTLKDIDAKYGRFSSEMVAAHRLAAELSWRSRQLKKEQDSWIRAARALDKQEPRDVRAVAFCYQRLGISRAIAGDFEGAEEAFAEALKVIRDQLGETSPELGRAERKIARVYTDLAKSDLAWRHHELALESLMKAFPAPTPEIAELHEEQAELLIDYRQFAKGIALLQRSIEVWQKIDNARSPHIARVHGRIANAQLLAGEMAEAERSARTQRDILLGAFASSAKPVRDADIDLAEILLNTGDPAKSAEAATLLKPWVAIPFDNKIADDADAAMRRSVYARTLIQPEQIADAVAQFTRAGNTLVNTQPRPSFLLAGHFRGYGQALLRAGQKFEALKALEDAEAEFSALIRTRPRYLRIATAQTDEIRKLSAEARK